jgi:hypothetical protein
MSENIKELKQSFLEQSKAAQEHGSEMFLKYAFDNQLKVERLKGKGISSQMEETSATPHRRITAIRGIF